MAFILAINPGSAQSPTLARLARELVGCELVGADTFEIATRALAQRVPDLVLLPEATATGEAEFLSRLGELPRGISALRLPQAGDIDFGELTAQIRQLLDEQADGRGQVPAGASAHVIAAARAMVRWIRLRRGLGPSAIEPVREPGSTLRTARPAAERIAAPQAPPGQWQPPSLRLQPLQLQAPPPPERLVDPLPVSVMADEEPEPASASPWPKVAAVALIALIAAGAYYWPVDTSAGRISQTATPVDGVASPPPPSAPAGVVPPAARAVEKPAPDGNTRLPGWIAVFAPFEIAVSEGNKAIPLDESGRAMLPAGAHKLRFRNQSLSYDEVRTVQIAPTETTSLSLTPDTTLSVTSNEPAEVLVDGTSVGPTPLKGHRIAFGTHTVVVRSADSQRELTVEATAKPVQLDLFFSKP